MKPVIGLSLSLLVSILVLGVGVLIWYLSSTAEFSRKASAPASTPATNQAPPATPPAKGP